MNVKSDWEFKRSYNSLIISGNFNFFEMTKCCIVVLKD